MQLWMKKLQFLFTPNICIFFYRGAVGELPKLGETTRLSKKKFKRGFVPRNQVSRQKAQTADVEKNFYELMNNANFSYDCRNNADNCYFSPIYDELEEPMYVKGYQNVFDQSISDFVSSEILERQIGEELLNKIAI